MPAYFTNAPIMVPEYIIMVPEPQRPYLCSWAMEKTLRGETVNLIAVTKAQDASTPTHTTIVRQHLHLHICAIEGRESCASPVRAPNLT
jgi:hypothetical protein